MAVECPAECKDGEKMSAYLDAVIELYKKVERENQGTIDAVSSELCKVVDRGGVLYVFGSGHSVVLSIEAFHRAGGMVPVYPITYEFLTPLESPKISGKMERLEGLAQILFARANPRSSDLIWIASNSGINATAIEMAQCAKQQGLKVVCTTSLAHSQASQSRHSSGKKLYELSDFVFDNCCPPGDAMVEVTPEVRACAGSTLSNVFLYNSVLAKSAAQWSREGKKIPIYRSANIAGGEKFNEEIEALFKSRIPLL